MPLEVAMVVAPRSTVSVAKPVDRESSALVELGIICAAGLFFSVLLMTYGVDRRPGLF
jgi:hypothetical protein